MKQTSAASKTREQGYPLNPDVSANETRVTAPHVELINFALEGACVFARMVLHKLDTRAAMEDLRTTKQSIYNTKWTSCETGWISQAPLAEASLWVTICLGRKPFGRQWGRIQCWQVSLGKPETWSSATVDEELVSGTRRPNRPDDTC